MALRDLSNQLQQAACVVVRKWYQSQGQGSPERRENGRGENEDVMEGEFQEA
jgi:hypothetical protein